MARRILERDDELAVLAKAATEAAQGSGSVALVYGEAGIGKSSLVTAAAAQLVQPARMLIGYCDDLATQRPFGPLRDLVCSVGSELAEAVMAGRDRDAVLAALRSELSWPDRPTTLVIEDVHWADDATLDALRYLVRRIATLPAVLVLTYRDDEVGPEHPLHQLLGLVSRAERCHRLPLRRLSPEAVGELSGDAQTGARVFDVTAGNPFFVTEIIAAGETERVPGNVVEAVLARVHRLARPMRETLEQLAVVPSTIDSWLVDELAPGGLGALAEAEQFGLLVVSPDGAAFRHELTRRAIVDALPASRRVELNRRVLAALIARGGVDLSYVVHHAAQAGDRAAIATYGPAAARDAVAAGSHREALAHYRLVLTEPQRFPVGEQARLLEEYAVECYTLGEAVAAVGAQRQAVNLYKQLGDTPALAAALRWLSRVHWWAGDTPAADAAAREAIEVARRCEDDGLLALALSNQSQLDMLAFRDESAIQFGQQAAALAKRAGDDATLAHALTNVGLAQWHRDDAEGFDTLLLALRSALDCGALDNALRAYVGIASGLLDRFEPARARQYLDEALHLAEGSEHLGFHGYLLLEKARLEFIQCAWGEVFRLASFALGERPPLRWGALLAIGRTKVRLGEPDGERLLWQGWELACDMRELQRTGPIAAGLAEAAWLRDDLEAVRAIAEPVYREACAAGEVAIATELAFWLRQAGVDADPLSDEHPYASREAVLWRERGCPYEYAMALLTFGDTPEQLLAALAELARIGAKPLAERVRRRLRDLGTARIPRGPMPQTRSNAAGLTARQLAVIRLVAQGLTNADIARELTLSVRTVDTHVAAVLDKLGCQNRQQAVARAAELGLLDADIGNRRA